MLKNPIQIRAGDASVATFHEALPPRAILFVASVARGLRPVLDGLRVERRARHARIGRGEIPDFRPETRATREGSWRCRLEPAVLSKRHVGIISPPHSRLIAKARGSGADGFIADFEDATSPTFANILQGQIDLRHAVHGEVPAPGAMTLFVRPRGIHLPERHVVVDDRPAPAALFDVAVFCHHNARALAARGAGPFFFVPKVETYEEARFWNRVFDLIETELDIPRGTIKVTVSIETISAAFQMHEILWELRGRSAGLHFGRRELVFDFIKTRARDPRAILPDRREMTMDRSFLAAISALLVKTAHRRGVHAIGGMAAQVPIPESRARNAQGVAMVRAEKIREASNGYDGTLVAHPALVRVARQVFGAIIAGADQLHVTRDDVFVGREELLSIPSGPRTENAVRESMRLLLAYLEAWLRGDGFIVIEHRVVDSAAAEVARAQLWKWAHHFARLDDGTLLTSARFRQWLDEEARRIGAVGRVRALVERLCLAPRLADFMTPIAYDVLTSPSLEPLERDRAQGSRCAADSREAG